VEELSGILPAEKWVTAAATVGDASKALHLTLTCTLLPKQTWKETGDAQAAANECCLC